jgi:hypothetical protein
MTSFKQILIIILPVILCLPTLASQTRTEEEAKIIARKFLAGTGEKPATLNIARNGIENLRSAAGPAAYYAFNREAQSGFVIVSASDAAKEVLAYSRNGEFNYHRLPPNLRSWLDFYEYEINTAEDAANAPPRRARMAGAEPETSVPPLLSTRWGQGSPFGDLCPVIRDTLTPAGCVATAMAQIMKYHRWPLHGFGARNYTPAAVGKNLAVNFSTATYEWDLMLDRYNESSPPAARRAVATLMYHCGVAVEMNYGTIESGASSESALTALEANFGYDPGMDLYRRDHYSLAEWSDLLRAEISAGRPVYYAGTGSSGGHAFVCDGYDANGFFHFNWGYNGYFDGYFELSALNPGKITPGGGASGYNYKQMIIAGIRPSTSPTAPAGARLDFGSISAGTGKLATLRDTFSITIEHVSNYGASLFAGTLGYAICRSDLSVVEYRYDAIEAGEALPPNYYYYPVAWRGVSLPEGISRGAYRIVPAYSLDISGNNILLMDKTAELKRSLILNVSAGGEATIESSAGSANLSLVSLLATTALYRGKTVEFEAIVKNSGTADYHSDLKLEIGSAAITEPVTVRPGASRRVQFSLAITMPTGNYTATLSADAANHSAAPRWIYLGATPVTVNAAPQPPSLSFVSAAFPDPQQVDKYRPRLAAEISNSGGMFDGAITAFVFAPGGGSSLTFFGMQQALIDNNQTKQLLFDTPIDLASGKYIAAVFSSDNGSDWTQLSNAIAFTIPALTAAEAVSAPSVTVSANRSYIYITTTAPASDIILYDLSGRARISRKPAASGMIALPASGLTPGVYLLSIRINNNIETKKIIIR